MDSHESVNLVAAVDEMNGYLVRLQDGTEELITLWQTGDLNKGSKLFVLWTEGIQAWLELIQGIWRVFGQQEDFAVLSEQLNQFNNNLGQVIASINNNDYILASDQLEYVILSDLKNLAGCTGQLTKFNRKDIKTICNKLV
ncbi:MAG: hypothetical protein A4E53_00602 [Pelotomaculum sp. PtaB.Bin104]|nr:MAG: hypothetical protein A4E53_00602 [Pelotomaculum sp. PtaB.Bin104]